MTFNYIIALHNSTLGTPPSDTVYLGALSLDPWQRISVLGDSTTWKELSSDGNQQVVLASDKKIAASVDAGKTWAALTDSANNVSALYNLNGIFFAICDNGAILKFNGSLTSYTTHSIGGSIVDASAWHGMAVEGNTIVAVAGDTMKVTKSLDAGDSWFDWIDTTLSSEPRSLHKTIGGPWVVASFNGYNISSTSNGDSWSAPLVITNTGDLPSFGEATSSTPGIWAGVTLNDRIMLVGRHIASTGDSSGVDRHRPMLYFTSGTDLYFWTAGENPIDFVGAAAISGHFIDNFSYYKEYEILAPPGTAATEVSLQSQTPGNTNALTSKNIIFDFEIGALWQGFHGTFTQTYFGTNSEPRSNWDHQINYPWWRTDPLSVKAMAIVKRDEMPKTKPINPPQYADLLS